MTAQTPAFAERVRDVVADDHAGFCHALKPDLVGLRHTDIDPRMDTRAREPR